MEVKLSPEYAISHALGGCRVSDFKGLNKGKKYWTGTTNKPNLFVHVCQ